MCLRHSWCDVFRFFGVNLSDALNEENHRQDHSETSEDHQEGVELLLVCEWRILEMLVLDLLAVEWGRSGRDCVSICQILGDSCIALVSSKLVLDVSILISCDLVHVCICVKQDSRLASCVHVALSIETVRVVVAGFLITEVADPVVIADHLRELDIGLLDQRRRIHE